MEDINFRDYCLSIRMVNYNHIETQVKRFDTTVITTQDVKDTKILLASLLYQG